MKVSQNLIFPTTVTLPSHPRYICQYSHHPPDISLAREDNPVKAPQGRPLKLENAPRNIPNLSGENCHLSGPGTQLKEPGNKSRDN